MNDRRTFTLLGSLPSATSCLGALCLTFALPAAQEKSAPGANFSGAYQIDSVHSTVIFKVKHLNTSWSYGRFNKIGGNLTYDAAKPENSTIQVEIDVESLDTANAKRDGHLKSPDFFDAVQFPTATFASKSIKKSSEGKYSMSGDLELHGVKKPLTVELEEVGKSDVMGVRVGFHTVFSVRRSDFGMKFMPDAVGDDVQVTVSIEAIKPDAGAR